MKPTYRNIMLIIHAIFLAVFVGMVIFFPLITGMSVRDTLIGCGYAYIFMVVVMSAFYLLVRFTIPR